MHWADVGRYWQEAALGVAFAALSGWLAGMSPLTHVAVVTVMVAAALYRIHVYATRCEQAAAAVLRHNQAVEDNERIADLLAERGWGYAQSTRQLERLSQRDLRVRPEYKLPSDPL